MNQDLCRAIEDRRIVQFEYDGHRRVVEPHCHGESTADHDVLRGFQVGGESESDDLPGWRLFDTAKMSDLSVTDEPFSGEREGYTPTDPDVVEVYCQV